MEIGCRLLLFWQPLVRCSCAIRLMTSRASSSKLFSVFFFYIPQATPTACLPSGHVKRCQDMTCKSDFVMCHPGTCSRFQWHHPKVHYHSPSTSISFFFLLILGFSEAKPIAVHNPHVHLNLMTFSRYCVLIHAKCWFISAPWSAPTLLNRI